MAEQFVEAVVAGGQALALGSRRWPWPALRRCGSCRRGRRAVRRGRFWPRRTACGRAQIRAAAAAGRRGRRHAGGPRRSSGRSRPARMRSRVVLPTPLGPTRPTRSPACSSKPTFRNRGPASKPRDRSEQLSNSIVQYRHSLPLARGRPRARSAKQGRAATVPGFAARPCLALRTRGLSPGRGEQETAVQITGAAGRARRKRWITSGLAAPGRAR